jgi:hypothetical protein
LSLDSNNSSGREGSVFGCQIELRKSAPQLLARRLGEGELLVIW